MLTRVAHRPEGTGAEQLRQRTLMRVFERLLQLRRVFGPALFGFALWIAISDAAVWRRAMMIGILGVLGVTIAHDVVVGRRGLASEGSQRVLVPNLVAVSLMQHALIFASGGMASPVLPLILPLIFLSGLLNSPRLSWTLALAIHLPALWIEAGVHLLGLVELTPTALAGYGAPAPTLTLVLAIVMSLAVIMTTSMSTTATTALTEMIGEALEARDAALASRAEQTRQLTTLSGEIAHELKNPLASVKGLAALIEREPLQGKAAERMQVLRREVDRMQGILDEFLNFSRPLVPLDQRELELRELVDHVVDLLEGVAGERRVSLVARGRARLRCDPRKIEQVLINLIQNALEVAPPGSSIELEIRRARADAPAGEGDELIVEIRDAGPGLADELRSRVFEAGVTDKPEGSGLGLTIARALARQHGGELELGDRRDGRPGCEASLRLPVAGLEIPEEATA